MLEEGMYIKLFKHANAMTFEVKEVDYINNTVVFYDEDVRYVETMSSIYAYGPDRNNLHRGSFIAVEGPDGCGKSTLISALKTEFKRDDRFEFVKEPEDKGLGKFIRDEQHKITDDTKDLKDDYFNLLITADRLFQYYKIQGVNNLLQQGINVITDRCYFSTLAYVSGEFIDNSSFRDINKGLLVPDICFYLHLEDSAISLERLNSRRLLDVNENEKSITKAINNYTEVFKDKNNYFPDTKIVPVDASLDAFHVSSYVKDYLSENFKGVINA